MFLQTAAPFGGHQHPHIWLGRFQVWQPEIVRGCRKLSFCPVVLHVDRVSRRLKVYKPHASGHLQVRFCGSELKTLKMNGHAD